MDTGPSKAGSGGGRTFPPRGEDDPLHARRLARLGGLVGGFAHEIRNPLSTIGLNLRLLEEELSDPSNSRETRLLKRTQRLSKEVKRLQDILDAFLDYVRAPKPKLVRLSLNTLVREVGELVTAGIEKEGISLRFFLAEGLPELEADAGMLHQILLNLITNAHQALKEGEGPGEILVGTSLDEKTGWQELFVVDSGPGMDAEILERCFQPYFSTKRGGTGLGLAITRRFVEDHGGTIQVESKAGTGTRFLIRLPCRAREAEAEPDAGAPE